MLDSQCILEDISGTTPVTRKKVIKKVHFVGYQWDQLLENLKLYYYDKSTMTAVDWVPDKIDITVSGPRKCIGFFQNDRYHPCIRNRSVDDFPQCYKCVSKTIPRLRCIFEPACYGDKCPEAICSQPHQVYLAFFNSHPKIGMSSKSRLKLRVTEQGADAYSIVATVPDRLSARLLERSISKILQMRESYDPEEILKNLTRRIQEKEIDEKYDLISTSLKDRFDIKCSKLNYIKNYQMELPLRSMPKLQKTIGIHKGIFVGIKGKFIIYDSKGFNALRLDELLGNYIFFKNQT